MKILSQILALFSILAFPGLASADGKLVEKMSAQSVSETADRAETAIKTKGLVVVARINHSAAAQAAGLSLPDTQLLLFGNPKLGTPLIAANPDIAIELPLRLLIWATADGQTHVGYIPAEELLSRYGLGANADAVSKINSTLAAIATSAAQGQ